MAGQKTLDDELKARLAKRMLDGTLRQLRNANTLTPATLPIDFCSNDYLGFAKSGELKALIKNELDSLPNYSNGSGGSRLLSGNTFYAEETEKFLANYYSTSAALFFNSGYDANIGLLSCIPQRGDTIISDELIHASLIDGCRLSLAFRFKFKHNNLIDLEGKLKNAKANTFVVIESVYSMDGDFAPLAEIASLCEKYKANLIVDEAHATGVFGSAGRGKVAELGLENKVFARIVTFGKAMGSHGAAVLGSETLRAYLINFARSFIYTTAAPIHTLVTIKAAYVLLTKTQNQQLHTNIAFFKKTARERNINCLESDSPIQAVLFSSNQAAKNAAKHLQENGFDARAILSPTVPKGTERIRICIHQFNTEEEIAALIACLTIN